MNEGVRTLKFGNLLDKSEWKATFIISLVHLDLSETGGSFNAILISTHLKIA